jgi:penicillin-binding protein 1A
MLAGLQQNPIYANPIVNPARTPAPAAGCCTAWWPSVSSAPPSTTRPWPEAGAAASPASWTCRRARGRDGAPSWWWNAWARRPTPRAARLHLGTREDQQRVAHAAAPRRDGARTQAGLARPRGPGGPATGAEEAERAAALALKDHRDDDDLRVAIVLAPAHGRDSQAGQRRAGDINGAGLRQAAMPGLRPWARKPTRRWPSAAARCCGCTSAAWQGQRPGRSCSGRRPTPPSWRWTRPAAACARWWAASTSTASSSTTPPALAPAGLQLQALPVLGRAGARRDARHGGQRRAAAQPGRKRAATTGTRRTATASSTARSRVREGLVRSKNLVSVRLLQHIGLPRRASGLALRPRPDGKQPDNLTLALGAGSVTPLQLARPTPCSPTAAGAWRRC